MLRKLEIISISTLKRMLSNTNKSTEKISRKRFPKRKRNTFKESFPMRKIPYDTPKPGHFEVELVLHCDEDSSGEYIHTIQMTDVATGWCENQAVFGRSYRVMQDGFESILENSPIPVIELHPDNGSEFFNQHLLRFWKNKIPELFITRSRPYHKNDNPPPRYNSIGRSVNRSKSTSWLSLSGVHITLFRHIDLTDCGCAY